MSSCSPPIYRKPVSVTFDDFGGWAAHPPVFSVACNSVFEMLAALQTVETAVRTQKHRLDAEKFPIFSGGRTRQESCRDLIPNWFEKRVVTMM